MNSSTDGERPIEKRVPQALLALIVIVPCLYFTARGLERRKNELDEDVKNKTRDVIAANADIGHFDAVLLAIMAAAKTDKTAYAFVAKYDLQKAPGLKSGNLGR